MESYTLMWVGDERAPVRRIQISRVRLRRALWAAGFSVLEILPDALRAALTAAKPMQKR